MSILDIFNARPPIATVQQQPVPGAPFATPPAAQPGAPGTPGNPGIAPAGATPFPAPTDPLAFQAGRTAGNESPLANFADLWKIDAKDMPQDAAAALTPTFNVDPAAVSAAARTVDYAKLVPPETLTKAMSGDALAFSQVLNAVTQAATANAGMNSAKIVEAALAHQAKKFAEILPGEVRRQQVSMQVSQDHPIFSDPAAAPMVEGLKRQFTDKYPTASPQQISEYTTQYLEGFVKKMGGSMPDPAAAAAAAAATKNSGETDWGNFFSVDFGK